MSAFQCWSAQRERLREALKTADDAATIAVAVRHALSQVEQNTMAEQADDLLRQQTGILFSSCKASLNLLDISVSTKVWVAQSLIQKPKNRAGVSLFIASGALVLFAGGYAYFKELFLVWVPLVAAIVLAIIGFLTLRRTTRKANASWEDRLRITARPDADKLFIAIDAQMKAIDRFVNDFTYLNDQNALPGGTPDPGSIPLLAGLMESVYECDGDAGEGATEAASRLLEDMGVISLRYGTEASRYFNILPSLSETRTLTPALVSRKDGALLYRGTAAVRTPAATDGDVSSLSPTAGTTNP